MQPDPGIPEPPANGLSDLHSWLEKWFGLLSFPPGHEAVLRALLAGRSTMALFPAGAGKSLCYQLGALLQPHLTLVAHSPLNPLHDQLEYLRSRDISAAVIDSNCPPERIRHTMESVRANTLKILMVSVERLNNTYFRQSLNGVNVSLLVVDEAHCISEWSHNFRADYLKLPLYVKTLSIPKVLLLTASAPPRVVADLQTRFTISSSDVVRTSFYSNNLDLSVITVTAEQKDQQLINWLQARDTWPTVIYVAQPKTAQTLAVTLRKHGIQTINCYERLNRAIHTRKQWSSNSGDKHCLIAPLFGTGLGQQDIRSVIHYHLPKSVENYCQALGRTGRGNQRCYCLVLGSDDAIQTIRAQENIVYGQTPSHRGIRQVLEAIREAGNYWEVVIHSLSSTTDIGLMPLKTLLVYLELDGIIQPHYNYFAEYRLQYRRPPAELVQQFRGERQQFVQALLGQVRMARTWGTLDTCDIDELCRHYPGAERNRVIRALDYFAQQGWLVLEGRQLTKVYQVLNNHFVLNNLAGYLHRRFLRREKAQIDRLHALVALFESEQCLNYQLAEWFGDHQAPRRCGHCSACRGQAIAFPRASLQPPPEQIAIPALLAELEKILNRQGDIKIRVHFLCGVPSPRLSQLHAHLLTGWAALAQWPWQRVAREVNTLYDWLSPAPGQENCAKT